MTKVDLYAHFKALKAECEWDGEIKGNFYTVAFASANRNHIDEFIGLASLLPGCEVMDISWTIPMSNHGWRYAVSHPSGQRVVTQAQVPVMLKSTFRG